jgi:hypothetical protein
MGIITPGKSTVLRKGRMGNVSGTLVMVILSSSSSEIRGIKSVSSFTGDEKNNPAFFFSCSMLIKKYPPEKLTK